jgi:hypothetical protein
MCLPSLAWAQTKTERNAEEEAKAQFQVGVELFEDGDFAQAALAFSRAYELKPSYRILFNLGQVENENKHYAKALKAYVQYLADGGSQISDERKAEVKREIKRLNTLVGSIAVEGVPARATLFIDGKRSGETPLAGPVFVDLGEHEVVLKRGAQEIHREIVAVSGGKQARVELEPSIAPLVPGTAEPPQPLKKAESDEPQTSGPQDGRQRRWTWVVAGAAAALAVTGGIIGGVSISKKNTLVHECGDGSCLKSREADRDTVNNLSLTADVLYVVAGAAAVAAVVLFFVEPKRGKPERTAVIAPIASPEAIGLAFQGRF